MKAPLKGLLSLMGGDLATRVVGFLATVYLARILAPESFGIINVGLAVLGYLQLLSSPGIQILETRNVAARAMNVAERAGAVVALRIVLSCTLLLLLALALPLFVRDAVLSSVILWYAASVVPMALIIDFVLQGREKFFEMSLPRVLGVLVFAAGCFVLVRSPHDLLWTPISFLAGNFVVAGGVFVLVSRDHGWIPPRWDFAAMWTVLRDNLPVGGAVFLAQMVTNLPPLLLVAFYNSSEVGIYSAAMKIAFAVLIVDRVINAMFLPVVTRHVKTQPENVRRLVRLSAKVVFLAATPLAVGGILAAPTLVHLVFGSGYEGAVVVFRILMGYVFLTLLNSVFVCTVIASNGEERYFHAMLGGTIVLAAAMTALTIPFGAPGTAVGACLGEAFVVILMIRAASFRVDIPSLSTFIQPALAGALTTLSAWLLRDSSIVLSISVSLVVFVAAVVVFRGLRAEEVRYLRERFV